MKENVIETWKDIAGYENYEVSNLGRIRKKSSTHNYKCGNSYTTKEIIIKQFKNEKGYLLVRFTKNGKKKKFRVHRLVAEAFIPNTNNLPQINHKDEDKANNHIDNLEWCDAKYNNNYGTRNERVSRTLKAKNNNCM